MRILAIRIQNLASLEGLTEIRFDSGALGSSGLFAITGPTGAGKSTLLDAMCLALFNKTPRLDNHGGSDVGRPDQPRLKANDVRSIITRGRTSGWAEIEYRGQDGEVYVSRWGARRAKNKPGGNFQDETMTLRRPGAEAPITSRKGEVVKHNEANLRLNFKQFTRSVLLAQGDFAAFLKADANTRASLLEWMTGTELYSQLSAAAHSEAKIVSEALRSLQQDATSAMPLGEADRTALEARIETLEKRHLAVNEALRDLEKAQEWYTRSADLCQALSTAVEEARLAAASLNDAEPATLALAEIEAAQPLRTTMTALQQREQSLRSLRTERPSLEESLLAQQRALQDLEAGLRAADALLAGAKGERERIGPELNSAKGLDALITERRKERITREEEGRQSAEALAQAVSARDTIVAALEAAISDIEFLAAELSANQALALLVDGWQGHQHAIEILASAHKEAREAEQQLTILDEEQTSCQAAVVRLETDLADFDRRLAEAIEAVSAIDAKLAATDFPALRAQRESTDAKQRLIAELSDCAKAARGAALDRETALSRLGAARAAESEAAARHTAAVADRETLRARHDQSKRSLILLEAALAYEDRRSDLRPGEPCPLCGAKEHPFGQHGPETRAIDALRTEHEALEKDIQTVDATATEAKTTVEHQREAARQAEAAAVLADETLAVQEREWTLRSPAYEGLPESASSEDTSLLLERLASETLAALTTLKREIDREYTLLTEQRQARETSSARQSERESAHAALRQAQSEIQRNAGDRALAMQARSQANTTIQRQQALLDPLLAPLQVGWAAALSGDAEAFRSSIEALVSAHRDLIARHKACSEQRANLAQQEGAVAATAKALREQDDKIQQSLGAACQSLARQEAERKGLLGGRTTDEVERSLDHAEAEATRERSRREQARDEAREQLGKLENRRVSLDAKIDTESRNLEDLHVTLAEELGQLGISQDALTLRLGHGPEWILTERERLARIRQEAIAAQTRLEMRQGLLKQHEETHQPALAAEAIAPQLAASRDDLARVNQDLGEAQVERKIDDGRRETSRALADSIATAQARHELWSALNELIGSHDGSKFKRFAQSLTLEALLVQANRHLHELAPRYRLERIPETDLDMQIVDTFMLDEARSINTLSGGETFLTSLALALAMASLASHNARIDTLFIDEGFGTLDEQTLDQALQTLEALQATGKQVGIISHVPGLGQRIGARITVRPDGMGRSCVEIRGPS